MAPFLSAVGTPRDRRGSEAAAGGPRERTASRHREESAERFANLGRKVSGGVPFDADFWQHVQSKAAPDHGGMHVPPRRNEFEENEHRQGYDSARLSDTGRRQQQVDDFLCSEAEQNQVLDKELEARRRRAETVVGQWAQDPSPRNRQSRRRRPSKPSEGMRQLEQQVADLRKKQAEQANLLFAQEEKHRQKEDQTLRLLQQQAEELQWQHAEELRLHAEEELRRQSTNDNVRRTTSATRLAEPEDNASDEEEMLGRKEREDEKRRWKEQLEEDSWKSHRFVGRRKSGDDDYVHRQMQTPTESSRRHSVEKENLGPAGVFDESCSGWQPKNDHEDQHDAPWQMDRESGWSQSPNHAEKVFANQARDERIYSQDAFDLRADVAEQGDFYDHDNIWQQQAQDFENVQRQVDEYWRQRTDEAGDRIHHMSEADRARWLEGLDQNELFQQVAREENHRQQQRQAHAAEAARQREKDIAEELRRQHLLEEMRLQQERQENERRWREQLEQEELRREAELRKQEEIRLQEIEQERQRHRLEMEELRRKEREYEEARKRELEEEQRRRQEFEAERRKKELEREERRRQKRAREKEEEARRQEDELRHQESFSEEQPKPFWDCEGGDQRPEFANAGRRQTSQDEKCDGQNKNKRRDSTSTKSDKGDSGQYEDAAKDEGKVPENKQEQNNNTVEPDQQNAAKAASKAEESSPRPQSLYDVLKVDSSATEEEIRKAYKRQCMKHHPDKGGSRERFEEVGSAYQILSDKALRKAYDQRGMDGVEHLRAKQKSSSQPSSNGAQEKVSEKAQPIVVEAYVPLEVAYAGGSVDVQVVRITACAHCGGSGTTPGACYMHCPTCEGQGSIQQYVQFGHMIVEQRAQCSTCAGQGMVLPSTALCGSCAGEQLVEEEVRVPFEIPPGVVERERLVAKGQGHAMPGLAAGDVTLVCRMQEHQRFYRKNNDLFAEQQVPLQVAICGGAFDVALLNGNSVRVSLPRGSVLSPGSIKCVPGEGMPKRQNPHLRGDLVLRFHVDFPESLSEDVAARLNSAFAGKSSEEDEPGASPSSPSRRQRQVPPTPDKQDGEVYLSDFDMDKFGQTLAQETREAYEDDEEEEKARAAAKAAKAAARGHREYRSSYNHFGGCAPPGAASCRQM